VKRRSKQERASPSCWAARRGALMMDKIDRSSQLGAALPHGMPSTDPEPARCARGRAILIAATPYGVAGRVFSLVSLTGFYAGEAWR